MTSNVKNARDSRRKIKKVSYLFRLLFQLAFVGFPIILILFWINAPSPLKIFPFEISFINHPYSGWKVMHVLSSQEKILGFLLSCFSMGVTELVLYFLIKLFSCYERAEIFTIKNVYYIRNIAYTLLVGQVVSSIQEGLMSTAMTWHNPPGHRIATISISGTNMGIILVALFLLLVSWIMKEGYHLQEEQAFTI